MAEKPKNNEIKITPEMILAGAKVLDESGLCDQPSIMNRPLAERILRAAISCGIQQKTP